MKKIILGLVFIVIAVGLLYGSGYLQKLTGFTTLSLSQAEYKSTGTQLPGTSDFWSGEIWILHVAQDQQGERAIGYIYEDEVESDTGERPTNDFYIDMEFLGQDCIYPLEPDRDATQIHGYTIEEWDPAMHGGDCFELDALTYCPDMLTYGQYVPIVGNCFCVDKIDRTNEIDPHFGPPYIRTQGQIYLESAGESIYSSFDTLQAGTLRGFICTNPPCTASNSFVYAYWNGYIGTGWSCPGIDAREPASAYYAYNVDEFGFPMTQVWKVGSITRYDTYKNLADSLESDIISACPTLFPGCGQDVIDLISIVESRADDAVLLEPFGTVVGATVVNDVTSSKDELFSDPQTIEIPMWTFYVKADFLGIEHPQPNIIITNAWQEGGCFKTSGQVKIMLQNTGTYGATDVSINCPTPFNSAPSARYSLAAGETTTIIRTLSATVFETTTVTCTATSNDGEHISTYDFSVCADPETVECIEGTRKCSAEDTIIKCLNKRWICEEACSDQDTEGCPNIGSVNGYCDMTFTGPVCKEAGDCANEGESCDFLRCCGSLKCAGGLFGTLGKTCQKPEIQIPWAEIILALLVVLSGVVFYAKMGRDKVWGVVGVVIGFIVAIIMYMVYQWLLIWWPVVALFGIVGFILLYLALGGGGILVLLFVAQELFGGKK